MSLFCTGIDFLSIQLVDRSRLICSQHLSFILKAKPPVEPPTRARWLHQKVTRAGLSPLLGSCSGLQFTITQTVSRYFAEALCLEPRQSWSRGQNESLYSDRIIRHLGFVLVKSIRTIDWQAVPWPVWFHLLLTLRKYEVLRGIKASESDVTNNTGREKEMAAVYAVKPDETSVGQIWMWDVFGRCRCFAEPWGYWVAHNNDLSNLLFFKMALMLELQWPLLPLCLQLWQQRVFLRGDVPLRSSNTCTKLILALKISDNGNFGQKQSTTGLLSFQVLFFLPLSCLKRISTLQLFQRISKQMYWNGCSNRNFFTFMWNSCILTQQSNSSRGGGRERHAIKNNTCHVYVHVCQRIRAGVQLFGLSG